MLSCADLFFESNCRIVQQHLHAIATSIAFRRS